MKRCPQCDRTEPDDKLTFCRVDGTALVSNSGGVGAETGTVKFGSAPVNEIETSILPQRTDASMNQTTAPTTALAGQSTPNTTRELNRAKRVRPAAFVIGATLLLAIVLAGSTYLYFGRNKPRAIESIAVMPFVNESGNSDVEYLSDGMTETLISSLSQLPNLNVKPRSTVFRYKGKAQYRAGVPPETLLVQPEGPASQIPREHGMTA